MLYIHGAAMVTPRVTIENGALLVKEGQIAALGSAEQVSCPAGVQKLDASGLLLAPGLIDMQFNGGFGHDFTESPAALWEVAAQLPRYGVTGFLPTIITSPRATVLSALEVLQDGPPPGWQGARPLGYHLEGPMLNPGKKGAHNPQYIQPPSLAVVEGWTADNGVRLVTLAPEREGALEVVHALRERGVRVSAGHSLATYEEACAAFEAGVICGTHLFNAMPALDHRKPGLAAAVLDSPGVCAGLIPDGIHVHPGVIRLVWKLMGAERLVLVTDAMAAMGMPPGDYRLGDYDVHVDETSARLADGTLAGSILTLDAAVRNMIRFTGCTVNEALACVSETPAHWMGLTHKGRLEVGLDADLVLLTQDGQVVRTIVGGETVFMGAL